MEPVALAAMDSKLEDILQESGVDPARANQIVADGWTVSTFACCALDLQDFEKAMDEMLPGLARYQSHGGHTMSLLEKSQLRAAFRACSNQASPDTKATVGEPTPGAAPAASTTSWSESFAPKLDHQVIQQLKQQFLKNYPSEILDSASMPSTRLLSLVYHQVQKGHWAWMGTFKAYSQQKSEDLQSQRSSKQPKLEGLSLHSLLLDEPPALEVSNSGMGLNAIRTLMDLHNVAVAMCRGAHLANLKQYSHRFMHYLTQKVDSETGHRTANVIEAQAADRQIWATMAELINDRDWTMDDALHELTHVRQDLAGLLQLRPKIPKPQLWSSSPSSSSPPGAQKGKGKQTSSKGKGKQKGKGNQPQWITEIRTADGSTKPLCMRFQLGKCKLSDCKFAHQCAYPAPAGHACGGPHGAMDHKQTPH
eukprot:s4100_g4.t1